MKAETKERALAAFTIESDSILATRDKMDMEAFEKAVEEGVAGCKDSSDYFYSNMNAIHVSMKKTNGSMGKELKEFSRRSGVQELMRISNIQLYARILSAATILLRHRHWR